MLKNVKTFLFGVAISAFFDWDFISTIDRKTRWLQNDMRRIFGEMVTKNEMWTGSISWCKKKDLLLLIILPFLHELLHAYDAQRSNKIRYLKFGRVEGIHSAPRQLQGNKREIQNFNLSRPF